MNIFKNLKNDGAESRLTEEIIYAQVLEEIQNGIRRDGLWAKALAESNMDEKNAKARYLILRVQSIKDENKVFEIRGKINSVNKKHESSEIKEAEKSYIKDTLGTTDKIYTCLNCDRKQNMLIKRGIISPMIWVVYILFGGIAGIVLGETLIALFGKNDLTIVLTPILPIVSYIFNYFYFLRKTTLQCPTCGNLGDLV